MERIIYDCDTYDYWCSEEDYSGKSNKKYGAFTDDNRAYRIDTKNTPRPWLNYLCNDKIASVISNTGMGFFWYKTSLLRITKYDHVIDYQPRTFKDGRDVLIEDTESHKTINVFRDADDIICVHKPGMSKITAKISGFTVDLELTVPKDDAGECWNVSIKSDAERKIRIFFKQTWSVARFGIHTAEEGIPYVSVPGKNQTVTKIENGVMLHTDNPELPVELWCGFISPQCRKSVILEEKELRNDGKCFIFPTAELYDEIDAEENKEYNYNIFSFAEEDKHTFDSLCGRYIHCSEFEKQKGAVAKMWDELLMYPSCSLPDKNIEMFLNIWLKNQIFTTFRYVRSGYIGYRDTIQDSWGYTLIEPGKVRNQILKTLSFMKSDGSCPRNYSPFGKNDRHDLRNTMDSATWIGMCINDYIQETGDAEILNEKIPYLDSDAEKTVLEHISQAMDLLYKMRGKDGFCLVADGDWNDAIEGISKSGPAVSVWLTMAFYYAQKQLIELYNVIGYTEIAEKYKTRNMELYSAIRNNGWDGEWFQYAISGNGEAVGSKDNEEGKIHLNSNTWAIFSGIADEEQTDKIFESIDKYLDTFVGPALLAPPYRKKPCNVGRIVNLEPGTFENGSVYQHAVCFYIFALLKAGRYDEACNTFAKLLPTNPENFDSRRTSEPYCMGNFYCGPTHKRAGQNFFTWFTGNPAWLLRMGFDEIIGVKATFNGMRIEPKVPKSWDRFEIIRKFRGTEYHIKFERSNTKGIWIDGEKCISNVLPISKCSSAEVVVKF